MAHWLLKTEPEAFSIDDLERLGVAPWDGVRSFMARRNLMAMQLGERAFFYHSSTEPKGVVGICEVVREAYPDHTAFDPESKYYDPKCKPEEPTWFMPDVRFVLKFPRIIELSELRKVPGLENMTLLQKGVRLSVQPVSDEEWAIICAIAGVDPDQPSTVIDPTIP